MQTFLILDYQHMAMIKVTTPSWMPFLKNPRAMEWGKTVLVPKKGWQHYFICLWVLFHCWCQLIYGSTACHQDEQSWIKLLIWLKNSLERKKNRVSNYFLWRVVVITSDMGEVLGGGHQDAEWSGSASFGSDFLRHLLKPTESCPKNRFLSSCIEMDPEESALCVARQF